MSLMTVLPPKQAQVRSAVQGVADAVSESWERDRRNSTGSVVSAAVLTLTGAALQGALPRGVAGIETIDLSPNPHVDLSKAVVPKIPKNIKMQLREEIPLV